MINLTLCEAKKMMKTEYSEETSTLLGAKDIKALRKTLRQTQAEFWSRFGVTQSRGSRFEKGFCLPTPVAILLELYVEKKVNDADLMAAAMRNSASDQGEDVIPSSAAAFHTAVLRASAENRAEMRGDIGEDIQRRI